MKLYDLSHHYLFSSPQANENEKDDEDYLVDHSIVLYLVNPEGEFVDFFTQRMEVKHIVEKIQHYARAFKKAA